VCTWHQEGLWLSDRDNLREVRFLVSKELVCSSVSLYEGLEEACGNSGTFVSWLAASFVLLHRVISLVSCIKRWMQMCPVVYEHQL